LWLAFERNDRKSALQSGVARGSSGTGTRQMQTVIKADDGDLITVHADDMSIEQLTVRLELESPAYGAAGEFDQLTLSTRCARELGKALIQSAELVELNSRRLCGAKHFDFISFNASMMKPDPATRPA
jgi:hypothetical protein